MTTHPPPPKKKNTHCLTGVKLIKITTVSNKQRKLNKEHCEPVPILCKCQRPSLLHAEEIPSEYLNNRNSLMSKMVHFESGQFRQF